MIHVNVRTSPGHRLKLRRKVRIAVALMALLSFALIWTPWGDAYIGIILAVGLFICAFSMLVAHCLNFLKSRSDGSVE